MKMERMKGLLEQQEQQELQAHLEPRVQQDKMGKFSPKVEMPVKLVKLVKQAMEGLLVQEEQPGQAVLL